MSDYVSELRRDLVEAAERQARRGRAGRASRALHPRAWSPTALAGAGAVAAAIVAVVVTLTTLAPPPKPSDAKIVATVQLGGQPRDAVLAGGSLWIADYEGRVVQLDPATHRVRRAIPVGGTPISVAAAGGVVWVISNDGGLAGSHLDQLDARTGKRLDRVAVAGNVRAAAAGAGGLWLLSDWRRRSLERIDLDSHRRTALIPRVDTVTLAANGQSVWTGWNDQMVEIDGATARVVNRARGLALNDASPGARTLLPDRDGIWVGDDARGLLVRVEGSRVVRRIPVGATTGVVARSGSAIWVSATSRPAGTHQLVRVDPDEGKVVQRVAFGADVPQALVPVGKDLWVITTGGKAMLVSPG